MIRVMAGDDDEYRFYLAVGAARKIVSQCRAHVESATSKLSSRVERAASATPHGRDLAAASDGDHSLAYRQRIAHVESMCNALLSHLRGLEVLLLHDTFYPLPAIPVVRSIAEVAASCSWILDSNIGPDERAARAYASLFRSLETTISATLPADAAMATMLRESLIQELRGRGVRVVRRVRNEVQTDEVSQVHVGRSQAKTNYQYSLRVATEIPLIAGTYSGMSGITHGEYTHLSSSWDSPDTHARLIGLVSQRSVEAWSRAVHTWVGVEPGPFINPNDQKNLIRSMPRALLAEFGGTQAG